MPSYVINLNPQPTSRDNEVHTSSCSTLNYATNLKDLGFFYTCHGAVARARELGYTNADGCYFCCRDCHKS